MRSRSRIMGGVVRSRIRKPVSGGSSALFRKFQADQNAVNSGGKVSRRPSRIKRIRLGRGRG